MFLRGRIKEGVALLFLFLSFSSASAQFTLLYQKDGLEVGAQAGFSVATAGDVNGDGKADFIVGFPYEDSIGPDRGLAIVYSGADGSALIIFNGFQDSMRAGYSVAAAGDVNGDGKADVIIGAPLNDSVTEKDVGAAYVISGATGLVLYSFDGDSANDRLGLSVAGAGDVNGDGRADFIVGSDLADPGGLAGAGSAFVYSGATGALLYQKNGAAADDQLGWSVASAGDVNGDGRADFIIGAIGVNAAGADAGRAYVYSGATGALLYQKNGVANGDFLGYSVGTAGDVNGDGKADFVVGAPTSNPVGLDAGSAFVYSGADGSLLFKKYGDSADFQLGYSVATAGDVNGDGKSDFIIGANTAHPGGLFRAGSAYLYSGATGALLYQVDGLVANDWLGSSVAGAGDVNGDGRSDIIVGAPSANPGGKTDAGSAFVYGLPAPPDPPVNLTPIYQKNGVDTARLGSSVAGAGDVNGDGKSDFIVGAPFANPGGLLDAGSAFVYSGATGALLFQKDGAAAGDLLGGPSVAGAGDVNGDGKDDFIVGAGNALGDAGSAYVYSGNTGALLYQKNGAGGDKLGWSVAGAGDVNGDGRADFIVGAFSALGGVGSAYVYSGASGTLLYQKDGADSGDQLGSSVASAGDVNGDGRADFIVGANQAGPGAVINNGYAVVYSGATGALLFQKNGTASSDQLGQSVAGAGDVNGDGKADFIIGAQRASPGGLSLAGSAYVYSGSTGALLYQKDGAAAGNSLGYSAASAGDVNGDGRADFIVGAYYASNLVGSAFVYSGATGVLLFQIDGSAMFDHLGHSVASAGDVNGDGKADVIIGAFAAGPEGAFEAGSAFLYYINRKPLLAPVGSPAGMAGQLFTFTVSASDPDGFFPALSVDSLTLPALDSVAFVDTGNGGGVFIWYPGPSQVGIHHVRFFASDGFLADTQLVTITVLADTLKSQKNGANPGDQLGASISGGGDVNGDGVADYIIGAPGADPVVFGEGNVSTDAGSVFIYSGKNDTLIYKINGTTSGDRLGGSVGLVGDANADGKGDFIIGAPEANGTAGAVYVYSGSTGLLLFQKNGSATGDRLGGSVGLVDDMNLDGNDEVVAGAPGVNSEAGAVYVYSGSTGGLLFQKTGGSSGDRLGGSVGISDDVLDYNGDNKADIIVGAEGTNSSTGSAYIYSGADGSLLETISGNATGDRLGGSVGFTFVTDVNGDSTADYVIGAPGASLSAGAIYVYSGSTGNLLFQKTGSSSSDRLGGSVGIQADVDGDGGADFIAGAPGTDDSAGAAFIYSGASGALIFQKNGDSTGDRLGGSVGIYADVSGLAHYIIGAPNADPNNNPDAGSAFIFQLQEKGDLNGDGILTAADVVHMLNCAFLGSSFGIDCANLSVADINCDGILTAADVVKELNGVFLGFSLDCSF